MNGGFGHVLDGSADAAVKARRMLQWDVANGVARRCWSGTVKVLTPGLTKHNLNIIN